MNPRVRFTVEFDMPTSNGIMQDEIFNNLQDIMIRVEDRGIVFWEIKGYSQNKDQILLNWKVISKKLIKDE